MCVVCIDTSAKDQIGKISSCHLSPFVKSYRPTSGHCDHSVPSSTIVNPVPVVGIGHLDRVPPQDVEAEGKVYQDDDERHKHKTKEPRFCRVAGRNEAVELSAIAVEAI